MKRRSDAGLLDNGIGQLADPVDLNRHPITRLKINHRIAGGSETMRRSGQNDRAGYESGAAAEKFDQRWNIENHVPCAPVLHDFPIENRFDL